MLTCEFIDKTFSNSQDNIYCALAVRPKMAVNVYIRAVQRNILFASPPRLLPTLVIPNSTVYELGNQSK